MSLSNPSKSVVFFLNKSSLCLENFLCLCGFSGLYPASFYYRGQNTVTLRTGLKQQPQLKLRLRFADRFHPPYNVMPASADQGALLPSASSMPLNLSGQLTFVCSFKLIGHFTLSIACHPLLSLHSHLLPRSCF